MNDGQTDILTLKQVGEQRAKRLRRMGIETVEDLLTHYPREHKDRTELTKISDLSEEGEVCFVAAPLAEGKTIYLKQGKLSFTRLQVKDESGKVTLVWYNQPYMADALQVGQMYLFTGKYSQKYGKKEVYATEYEKLSEGFAGGSIVPIYPATEGISQKMLRTLVRQALEETECRLPEEIPLWVRKEYHLCEKNFAVQQIHFPETQQHFLEARKRLVFEEFFLLQVALYRMKNSISKAGIVIECKKGLAELEKILPFSLTCAQKRVMQEVLDDLASAKVMNRLVQGDVGSGKTAVAVLAAYAVIENGFQVALMAPTEVLAAQHAKNFGKLFAPLGIETVLLSGSMGAAKKKQALANIASGQAQMVIGTHSVIQSSVQFHKIGLVITDEQHRFGVRQRAALSEKGQDPHTLVMTATPIPRTLALILYGDLDISVIDELPPGRQPIRTFALTEGYRARIYAFLEKECMAGGQAYVVCPMIEENEKVQTKAVLSYTEHLQQTLPKVSIGCLYGKMKPKEKAAVMEEFVSGRMQILVSTTVIEVGVDVPNATIMVVENAERFGLAQLHQLRGRVGRGNRQSYCILLSEAKTQIAAQRLEAMTKTSDGFVLAQKDLELRGPGDFFGTRQHGLPEMKIANLYRDLDLLKQAQEAAKELMEKDSTLSLPAHASLREKTEHFFSDAQTGL